jgi:hypothetical protein
MPTKFIAATMTAVTLLMGACDGSDVGDTRSTAPPSPTPQVALTPGAIVSVPTAFTPQPSPDLPHFDGVILLEPGPAGRDYLRTDDGAMYGIEGITDDVEAQLVAGRDGISRVRLIGALLQPVPDVANRQIRVSRIEPLAP